MRERRKISRVGFERRIELLIPKLQRCIQANSLNLSEGGLCLRIHETLEIRSSVMLRLFAQPRRKPLECKGRITWVVQRRDLRDAPPFLYDVGVEFIDPPARLRAIVSKVGLTLKPS
ncbi:MAG: PilZ domain-containing protein, partial [Candidatus Omnitrophica bacterium]|nr:PilZ domain-containing protein [Candidatus Omnitrophota bacterium]